MFKKHKTNREHFSNHPEVELALCQLRDSGFSMDQISIIGNDVGIRSHIAVAQKKNQLNAKTYSQRVNKRNYLVMVKGTDEEILQAELIFRHQGVHEWGIYDSLTNAHLEDKCFR